MITPQVILSHIPGGRVLDVATGSGGFIHFLLEGLSAYTEIIGLDNTERAAAAFGAAFQDKSTIHFEVGDAYRLHYPAASFDLVCLSNSLHHFEEPQAVLHEMLRVLRPDGHLLIAEMYQDEQTETQLTHVHLHHWWAAVDRISGIVHHETYPRAELVAMIQTLKLSNLVLYDISSTDEDPKAPEILAELIPVFERYIQRAAGYPDLQARGAELRQRVQDIGFHSATTLVALGKN